VADDLYSWFKMMYNIDDDTQPSMNEDLLEVLATFNKTASDTRTKRDALQAKMATDQMKAYLDYIKSSRDYHAKLEETAGKDRRVSAQTMTARANQLTKSMTDITRDTNAYAGTLLNDFRGTLETGTKADALDKLFQTLPGKGVKPQEQTPLNGALATQVFTAITNKSSLQDVTAADVTAALGDSANPQLVARTLDFLETSKQADRGVASAMKKVSSEVELLRKYAAGGDLGPADAEKIEDVIMSSARANAAFQGIAGRSQEEVQAAMDAYAEADKDYQRLLEREQTLYNYIFSPGNEGMFTRTGKILADPEFRAWAADNGFVVGDAAIGDDGGLAYYTPGNKDMAAIIAFNRQARTGGPARPFGTVRTGDLVRVTVTDPADRERVLRTRDLGDGKFAVKGRDVLSPSQYVDMGGRPRGVKIGTAGDKVYAQVDGKTYVYGDDGKFTLAEAPAGTTFTDGVVYNDDGTASRYMRVEDIIGEAPPPSFGGMDEGDDTNIQKSLGVEIVGADKLPAVGEMSYLGYRDRVNARTIGQYGSGAVSINGGQQVFTKGAKVEVLESRGGTTRAERVSDAISQRATRRAERIGEPTTRLTKEEVATVTPGLAVGGAPAPAEPSEEFRVPGVEAGEDAEFVEYKDGSVFALGEKGAQMVTPPRGSRLDTRLIPPSDAAYDALTDKMDAEGRVLSDAEAQAVRTRRVGAEQKEAPGEGPVIRDVRGNVIIDYGRTRTVGGDIREAVRGVGESVRGLFRRPGAEGKPEAGAPREGRVEAEAKAPRERKPLFPPLERKEQMERQAAMAALPPVDEALPESTGLAGPAASERGQEPRTPLAGAEPPKPRGMVGPQGDMQTPSTSAAKALDIGKGRQAMGLVERSRSERDADLREKAAAIRAKEAEKPGSALAEVAALGREFRERQKRPAGQVFSPSGREMPKGESALQKRRAFAAEKAAAEEEGMPVEQAKPRGPALLRSLQSAAVKG
jgi:hypothetical protein